MVSSLRGYLIESSLQKKPRRKGLCCTLSITNGVPTGREAMREKTRKNTGYKITSTHDATLCDRAKQETAAMWGGGERGPPRNVASSEGGGCRRRPRQLQEHQCANING